MSFTFKQFSVDDSGCPMKVGTDAVLLGAWADFSKAKAILDIGTGCGVLALMAAQRSDAQITAIDVHEEAIFRASANFFHSPWNGRLTAAAINFKIFASAGKQKYDYIISNPPFFSRSLKAPSQDRNLARHNDDSLPFEVLIFGVAAALQPSGKFGLVLPAAQADSFIGMARASGFGVLRLLNVKPYPDASPNRVLIEFIFNQHPAQVGDLAIRERSGSYTDAYRTLTRDFYLKF